MSSVSSRFIPLTGSSSRSSFGSMASARPSSTRFCTPYGSNPTGSRRHCSSSRKSTMSSTLARASTSSRLARPSQPIAASGPYPMWLCRPNIRLSRTVRLANSSTSWNVRAISDPRDAVEDRPAALWTVDPGEHVEGRGLAGAVRPDDGGQLVAAHREADAVDRLDAGEAQPHVVEDEDVPVGHESHRLRL